MLDFSSSDSELGERVRNVSKILIKSRAEQQEEVENQAYKRKLGDLIFDASFESGNLGYVEQVDSYEYDLMVRPDVVNPRFRIWFNFTVSNQRPNQSVVFTIVNLSEPIGLFHEGFTPVARSRLQPNWVRLHEDQVFYYKSRQHGNRMVLSLAFKFTTYDNEHQFALTYPYTYSQLTSFIDRCSVEMKRLNNKQFVSDRNNLRLLMERKSPEMFNTRQRRDQDRQSQLRTRSALGSSSLPVSWQQGDLHRKFNCQLDLTPKLQVNSLYKSYLSKLVHHVSVTSNQKSNDHTAASRPTVVILCRSYGNLDGAALFVCQGMMDFLLSQDSLAAAAREYMEFHFYPMLNPDSVYVGNSRSDLRGQTSFRASLSQTSSHYENLETFQENLAAAYSIARRLVILELRVNYELIGARLLGNQHQADSLAMERHLAFPRLLSRFADDFYLEQCSFSKRLAWPASYLYKMDLDGLHKGVDQYTLEVSPFGHYKRSLLERTYELYDQPKYFRLSKAIVYALLEYLRPKEGPLPVEVSGLLGAFQPTSGDIDDLTLRLARHKILESPRFG